VPAVSRLFSAYVMIDWSAAAAPRQGKDSIWIGVIKRDIRFRPTFEAFNPATRDAAMVQLREILADLGRRGERDRNYYSSTHRFARMPYARFL
jgi:hypothetical protein